MSLGERFWIPHEDLVWAPGTLEASAAEYLHFAIIVPLKNGESSKDNVKIFKDMAGALLRVHDEQLVGADNVVDLEEVNEAAVMAAVRQRFLRVQPHVYTRVSRILIAANPFQKLPIYSAQIMKQYLEAPDSMLCPPHIFGVAADAVTGLTVSLSNQAVLISGESGAGKTESTKLVLSNASEALIGRGKTAKKSDMSIADRVMQTNPILEAFGNAKTLRNNNSSRFGKWLQMEVSDGMVKGCVIKDYLLELTRVCFQGDGERNYHIFFQLQHEKSLNVEAPENYRYLKNGDFVAPGVDDLAEYQSLTASFDPLGFVAKSQHEILQLVLGVLYLGNADFEDDGNRGCSLADDGPVQKSSSLMGVNFHELKKALCVKSQLLGRDWTESPRNPAAAVGVRDSLARLLYGRLFKFLVVGINKQLASNVERDIAFFGVLDIAGFESFAKNSLEQLSINLSNEHLQQHFNNYIFKLELADYHRFKMKRSPAWA